MRLREPRELLWSYGRIIIPVDYIKIEFKDNKFIAENRVRTVVYNTCGCILHSGLK